MTENAVKVRSIPRATFARCKTGNNANSKRSAGNPLLFDDETSLYPIIHIEKNSDVITNIPDKLIIKYTDDYNITYIHTLILTKLKNEETVRVELLTISLDEERRKSTRPQTVLDRTITLNKIKSLEEEIDEIKSGRRYNNYLSSSGPIISKYKAIGSSSRRVSFSSGKVRDEEDSKRKERLLIIASYINIAQKYIEIDLMREIEMLDICDSCFGESDKIVSDENGLYVCSICGAERQIIMSNSNNETTTSHNDYYDGDNFHKSFIRYQGKQINRLPEEKMFMDLDKYFSSKNKLTSEEVRKQPLNERGKRIGTDIPMLITALRDTGYSEFYEDYNLIGQRYWGWELPDLSHLESIIMADYNLTQSIYNNMERERSSSLGTEYRLFKHLQLRGHNCTIDDFKIVRMRDSLEFHDSTWRNMCIRSGDPSIYFIPTI